MSHEGIINLIHNNPQIPTQFDADVGDAIPLANILNIFGGPGIATAGSGNTITISALGTSAEWATISSSQTMATNHGYICISGGAISLLLPPVSIVGDILEVTLDGSASFTITQGAGQSIKSGNTATTAGVTGSMASTQQGDSFKVVCSVANLRWNVISEMGNLTIV